MSHRLLTKQSPQPGHFDWFAPDFGGRVTIAANGSCIPDRHVDVDEEAAR